MENETQALATWSSRSVCNTACNIEPSWHRGCEGWKPAHTEVPRCFPHSWRCHHRGTPKPYPQRKHFVTHVIMLDACHVIRRHCSIAILGALTITCPQVREGALHLDPTAATQRATSRCHFVAHGARPPQAASAHARGLRAGGGGGGRHPHAHNHAHAYA